MIEILERMQIIEICERRMIEGGIFEWFKLLEYLNYRNAKQGFKRTLLKFLMI